ncbi:TPA: tyrosine-type recombinase/integrase [Clostridioides difficile]|nr:tyrosine-type recombinase/integrase [Clostridioides difficile]
MEAHSGQKVNPIKDIEDVFRLLNFLEEWNERNYLLALFGMCTGLRVGDILALKVADVTDLKLDKKGNKIRVSKDWIRVIEEKRDYNREVFLSDVIKSAIENYTQDKPGEEFLFKSGKRKKFNRPIQTRQAGRIIKGAAKKVGIKENVATHSLRKTFARHIYDEEENKTYALEPIRKILGHKTIEMTRRYIGIDKDEEVKAITKFTNKLKKRKRN